MQRRFVMFTGVLAAVLSLLLLFSGCSRDQDQDRPSAGRQELGGGLDFTLQDLQGKTFHMKEYNKRTILLIFGTTWCPSCRSEIPHFKEIYGQYTSRGLSVVYVNIQEPREKVARFSAKYQLPYRTLLDLSGDVAGAYGIRGVPAMILMKEGQLVTRDYRLIDAYLAKLFPG